MKFLKKLLFFSFSIIFIFIATSCSPTSSSKESIVLEHPYKNLKFVAGDTISVSWNVSVANPKVYYNYNKGTLGWQEFSTILPVSSSEVKVILPTSWYSDSFQIKVEDPSGKYKEGISEYFSVKYIVITNPKAGQTYKVGDTVDITFKVYASKLSSLQLVLSTNGGMQFKDMLTQSVSVSQSSVKWIIGQEEGNIFDYPSNNCIIKINEYTDKKIFDISGVFSVTE